MTKIAIIGEGGYVFPLRLVGDVLSKERLQPSVEYGAQLKLSEIRSMVDEMLAAEADWLPVFY